MATTKDTSTKEPESLKESMLNLLGGFERLYDGNLEQIAANLAFLARHLIHDHPIDHTRFELLTSKNPQTHMWRLILLYDKKVVVRGLSGQRDVVLEMLLEGSAEAIFEVQRLMKLQL